MQNGFLKVAAMTPQIRVADPMYNAARICECIDEGEENKAKIMVFPELCITGYTCGDLFLQERLLEQAKQALMVIAEHTDGVDSLIFVGLPLERDNRLYNVAAVLNCGEIMGFVPKSEIPSYGEHAEGRYFTAGNEIPVMLDFDGQEIPFGTNLLFTSDAIDGLSVACEICEDALVAKTPSTDHIAAGANVIVNLSASAEYVGKDEYRQLMVQSLSARLICGYIYANAGEGESTTDLVYGGHNIIAENGTILAQTKNFTCENLYSDLDIYRLRAERRKIRNFAPITDKEYMLIPFALVREETELTRTFEKMPFVPQDEAKRLKRCEEILSIQAYGLKKRMAHTHSKCAVIGISGGLDSTLALLVTAKTFDLLGLSHEGIKAVTMPCFGTTDRTYDNACRLSRMLGAELIEVDIKKSVTCHFEDIGQDMGKHDVTYENAQARERTQVLMDIANKENGMVIGTGDMSELALGWATYNGDHMSMYGVNAGVPKTLVRHLVRFYADTCEDEKLAAVLRDVLDTPVSPELLPPEDGKISQKTEDLVGPYELHDFFLYYMLRFGFSPSKVFRLALETFADDYSAETIYHWIRTFYRRFFMQQFKRSCLPDGPKVGSVGVSPRGDLRMPSDACADMWLEELEELQGIL